MNYNLQQELAIKTIDGPVLIIAGPGTGKTFTLVERVSYMVIDKNIDPSEIMITTFTNKAANELLDRLSLKFTEKNINKDVNEMMIGNFHSIARNILNKYIDFTHLKRGYINIDDIEKSYIIQKYINKFRRIENYNKYNSNRQYEILNITRIIKKIYEEGLIKRKNETNPLYRFYFDVIDVYQEILMKYNMLDFSGILYFTYKLLKENHIVREELQNKINYIMIDEYQDTNIVQEKIISLLLNKNKNLCVVGDDDQALYRFRGASVKNILNFEDKYDDVKKINLMQNYRSEDSILKFYGAYLNNLIDENPKLKQYRHNKILFSDKLAEENRVKKLIARDEEEWKEKIFECIQKLLSYEIINSLNEIAILFSSVNDKKAQSLISYLKKQGVDIYIPKTSNLLSQKEVLNLIGGIYAIFLPIIQTKKIYKDLEVQSFLDNCYNIFYSNMLKNKETEDFINRMSKFLLGNFSLTIQDIIYRLLAYYPFLEYMKDEDKAKKISRFMELIETFELVNVSYKINSENIQNFIEMFFYDFIKFIKNKKIGEFDEETIIPNKDSISVMTIHASKGMEYPVVIMASLWDQYFNSNSNFFIDNLEEFAKIYNNEQDFEPEEYKNILDYYRKNYTGFSRAKDLLILSGIDGKNSEISDEYKKIILNLENLKIEELNIKKGEIKDSKIKKSYSFTADILPYLECPIEYYYKRILKFKDIKTKALHYGSLVHEIIEFLNKAIINKKELSLNDIKQIAKEIASQKFIHGAISLTKEDLDNAIDEVLEYYKDISKIGIPLNSELNLIYSIKDYILEGNIDLIFEKDNKKHILDFKTGKAPDNEGNHESMSDYFKQINLYAYLYEKTKNEKIESMSLYFTGAKNGKKLYTFKFDEGKNAEVLELIENTIKRIENNEFFENKNCIDENSLLKYFIKKI